MIGMSNLMGPRMGVKEDMSFNLCMLVEWSIFW